MQIWQILSRRLKKFENLANLKGAFLFHLLRSLKPQSDSQKDPLSKKKLPPSIKNVTPTPAPFRPPSILPLLRKLNKSKNSRSQTRNFLGPNFNESLAISNFTQKTR